MSISIEKQNGAVRVDFKSGVFLISLLLQLMGGVYAYGRLAERVEHLMRDVTEIRAIVLQHDARAPARERGER